MRKERPRLVGALASFREVTQARRRAAILCLSRTRARLQTSSRCRDSRWFGRSLPFRPDRGLRRRSGILDRGSGLPLRQCRRLGAAAGVRHCRLRWQRIGSRGASSTALLWTAPKMLACEAGPCALPGPPGNRRTTGLGHEAPPRRFVRQPETPALAGRPGLLAWRHKLIPGNVTGV